MSSTPIVPGTGNLPPTGVGIILMSVLTAIVGLVVMFWWFGKLKDLPQEQILPVFVYGISSLAVVAFAFVDYGIGIKAFQDKDQDIGLIGVLSGAMNSVVAFGLLGMFIPRARHWYKDFVAKKKKNP